MKKVHQTLYAQQVDMGGIPVRQPLPTQNVEQVDPFLLLHHLKIDIKPGTDYKNAGVPPHPHRGFSPVSFVFEGGVGHQDSRGNRQEVGPGGVQWMNAGMGIIHSERPAKALAENGGTQELIQLWVHTPAAHKMDQPYYLAADKKDMPLITPEEGSGEIQLVSGEQSGQQGIVQTPLPMLSVMGRLQAGVKHTFSVPSGQNAMLYLLSGKAKLQGHGLLEGHELAILENEGTSIRIEVEEETKVLLISAEPINEPLATYGPFVLNNQTQIMEAMRDYQQGKMGFLVEEFD